MFYRQWLFSKLQQQIPRVRHDGNRGRSSKNVGPKTYCAFPLEMTNRNFMDLTLHELSCSGMHWKLDVYTF